MTRGLLDRAAGIELRKQCGGPATAEATADQLPARIVYLRKS